MRKSIARAGSSIRPSGLLATVEPPFTSPAPVRVRTRTRPAARLSPQEVGEPVQDQQRRHGEDGHDPPELSGAAFSCQGHDGTSFIDKAHEYRDKRVQTECR